MQDGQAEPKGATRRAFLEGCGTALLGAAAMGCGPQPVPAEPTPAPPSSGVEPPPQAESFWKSGGWFVHDTVDASQVEQGIIRARLGGAWRDLSLGELPERFVVWSFSERLPKLKHMAEHGFDPRDLDGPHNACVATFGGPEGDSFTALNTAYKGMGFLPRPDRVEEALTRVRGMGRRFQESGAGMQELMTLTTNFLATLYEDADLWDRRKQVSLELFSHRDKATHTFANMLANPVASCSFLAFPTFEIRAVPQLLHPQDPDLSEQARLAVDWTNAIHDFAHGAGGSGQQRITCVYHVVELYDDTPSADGRGRRLL